MGKARRTTTAGAQEARVRLRTAEAYLEVADLVLGETQRAEMPGVATGLAVLAGIAGSDVICASRLGQIHRGDDHRAAAELLRTATADGSKLATSFLRLIDLKDEAHYGVVLVSARKARDSLRWARQLVDRAREELER